MIEVNKIATKMTIGRIRNSDLYQIILFDNRNGKALNNLALDKDDLLELYAELGKFFSVEKLK